MEDVEIDELARPADSHVSVNTIVEEDGTSGRSAAQHAVRVGWEGEFGTYFIGYSATPEVIERMLRRMFIGEPEGNTDRILEVSTAVSGGLYFVPSQDFLDDLPPAPTAASGSTAPEQRMLAGAMALAAATGTENLGRTSMSSAPTRSSRPWPRSRCHYWACDAGGGIP